jgi:hypothetical protein
MAKKNQPPQDAARIEMVACGVPWCVGLAEPMRQYCRVHESDKLRTFSPPAVTRELEMRYEEAMRAARR